MGKALDPKPAMILAGAAIMMSFGMGMRQSLGLFLPPVTHDLALKAADFTFAVAVQNIAWGLSQAPMGAIADKWGLRPVMLLGGCLYVVGMLVMLSAGGAAMLTVSGGLVGMALACTASSLAMTASARAVSPERRSVVLGAVGACSSVGTLVIAPSLQFMLARWDWHVGVVFFILLAVAMLPAAFMAGAVDRMPRHDRATRDDAGGRWSGVRKPPLSGHDRRLFRLRPATDVPDHASAQLSRDLRSWTRC